MARPATPEPALLWGYLAHLSYNMWADRDWPDAPPDIAAKPYLRFDELVWDDLVERTAAAGINLVVLDLGDGVRYETHPEIAVENAWSTDRLRAELERLRSLGIEPVPKLNFSTAHDAWLGAYSRMVSTPRYYEVCDDLIREVVLLFDRPRFFHLGMDEETHEHQRHYAFSAVRQHELWWHDLHFLINAVQECGSRPWVWADPLWWHGEEFWAHMPTSVVQSNWYYGEQFDACGDAEGPERYRGVGVVRAYRDLADHGYDQIPTGSNWSTDTNFLSTVQYCSRHIPRQRLLGFLQTPWRPTTERWRNVHYSAIAQVAEARKWYEAAAQ